jgi:hypothetical protein
VNTVMNHRATLKVESFLSSRTTITLSRRTVVHGVSYFNVKDLQSYKGMHQQ